MDAVFIMMEEVHEGFCEELMKLAVQYGYSIKRATHTVALYTNHLPKVRASDDGTWRRLIVIPFHAKTEGTADIKIMQIISMKMQLHIFCHGLWKVQREPLRKTSVLLSQRLWKMPLHNIVA